MTMVRNQFFQAMSIDVAHNFIEFLDLKQRTVEFRGIFNVLPSKKAYELWLVPTSGAPPIPIGVFKPDSQGSAPVLMPPLPKDLQAKAFAITVEPETGSTSPTMPIILAGKA